MEPVKSDDEDTIKKMFTKFKDNITNIRWVDSISSVVMHASCIHKYHTNDACMRLDDCHSRPVFPSTKLQETLKGLLLWSSLHKKQQLR